MRCGLLGVDTHPEIINRACYVWFYPPSPYSRYPCKCYRRCQKCIADLISEEPKAMQLHKQYMMQKRGKKK